MPYSCVEWGNIGQEGIPLIVETNGQFYNWFSIGNYYGVIIVLDHNMVFRYYGSNANQVINIVNQILIEITVIINIVLENKMCDYSRLRDHESSMLLMIGLQGKHRGMRWSPELGIEKS